MPMWAPGRAGGGGGVWPAVGASGSHGRPNQSKGRGPGAPALALCAAPPARPGAHIGKGQWGLEAAGGTCYDRITNSKESGNGICKN